MDDCELSLEISEEKELSTAIDSFKRFASSNMEFVMIGCSSSRELLSSLREDISSSDAS